MKILNKRVKKATPAFEFKKGSVYTHREDGGTYICLNMGTLGEQEQLRIFDLTFNNKYQHGLPLADPAKWEEVEATLTITNL